MTCPEAESLPGWQIRGITVQSGRGERHGIKPYAMKTHTRRAIDKRRYL